MAAAKSDLEFCKRITRRGGSNLWLVSKALPAAKKDLFAACYASMRYIDDFVDEEFQALSKSSAPGTTRGCIAACGRLAEAIASVFGKQCHA